MNVKHSIKQTGLSKIWAFVRKNIAFWVTFNKTIVDSSVRDLRSCQISESTSVSFRAEASTQRWGELCTTAQTIYSWVADAWSPVSKSLLLKLVPSSPMALESELMVPVVGNEE